MQIYPYSPTWYLYIIAAIYLIYEIKKKYKNEKIQTRKDFIKQFNILVILYWIIYKYMLSIDPNYNFNIWNELPLHMCNLTCILFLIASIKDWNTLRGLCFFTGTIGVIFALIMPDTNFTNIPTLSFRAIGYWGYHTLMIVQSVSLITLNIIQPDTKDVTHIILLLIIITLVIHGINVLLRQTICQDANYFYTFGIPENIIMDYLQQKIPHPFLFMLPIILPLWFVCTSISYGIQIIKNKQKLV